MTAEKCVSMGINMYCLHFPAYNICKDKFVRIETCFACYKPEDHFYSNCPMKQQNPDYRVCSNCAQNTHTFQNCRAQRNQYRCVNCNGEQSAMSMACLMRKDALKSKRQNLNALTMSDTVKLSHTVPSASNDVISKSVSLLMLTILVDFLMN